MKQEPRNVPTEVECPICRERARMRASIPKSFDPIFINARKGLSDAKERAIQIASLLIKLVSLHVQDKINRMIACGDARYIGVDLAQVENDLQDSAEREINTTITRGNERSILDAGEEDEYAEDRHEYKRLEHRIFERFWTRVHNLRNGNLGAPRANQAACDAAATDAIEQIELDIEVAAAVAKLPAPLRKIYLLVQSGMSQTEVAVALNVSKPTVSRNYAKAKALLAFYLGLDGRDGRS